MTRRSVRSAASGALLLVILLGTAGSALARHHKRAGGGEPGQFDYYLLSLSWSPAFCLSSPGSPECNGPRRYGFIVHGLWPQNEQGWPEHCGSEPVADSVVDSISDLMPARALVYHEWSTHGTCSGLSSAAYFGLVRQAYAAVAQPPQFKDLPSAIEQSPAAITAAFMHANPQLPPQSVVVSCSGQSTPRLREVHVCFDRDLKARACSADALREGCRAASLIVPPIR
jgi:ribonuclease T2